jgi:hypothetical protein
MVLVHLCNGERGILAEVVGVATGEKDEGTAAHCVLVQGHPHEEHEESEENVAARGGLDRSGDHGQAAEHEDILPGDSGRLVLQL